MKFALFTLLLLLTNTYSYSQKITFDLLVNDQLGVTAVKDRKPMKLTVVGTGAKEFKLSAAGGSLVKIEDYYVLTPHENSNSVTVTVFAVKRGKDITLGANLIRIEKPE